MVKECCHVRLALIYNVCHSREDHRQEEIQKLVQQGKIPHEVELEKHPEKSMEGRMWLMGKVAGSINVCIYFLVTVVSSNLIPLYRTLNPPKQCKCPSYQFQRVITWHALVSMKSSLPPLQA